MSIFDKWDKNVDVEGLQKDIAEAEKSNGSGKYDEVPTGNYEVKIEKMEIKESKKGDPMFFCQFRILQGNFKNSCMFMNQVITQGFQIGQVNKFLRSLDVEIIKKVKKVEQEYDEAKDTYVDVIVEKEQIVPIEFKSYGQYNELILDIMEEVDGKLEFLVEFKKSKKDFPIYEIKEVYEVE